VIVIHDPFLSRSTNIEDLPQYKERKVIKTIDKEDKNDWWVIDFDTKELKELTTK
jgi:hypothetical protein